ncbi:MAG TPA: hypothetical protein VLH15_04825 [Dehalococcoidales bacterium]|nr:hypothetical protein [Dehalococcoidales bacterium]
MHDNNNLPGSKSDSIDKITAGGILFLNPVEAVPDIKRITARLKLNVSSPLPESRIRQILATLSQKAQPRAACKLSLETGKLNHSLKIDGVRFDAPFLRVNLASAKLIFPFMVTAGEELESFQLNTRNVDEDYCLKTIKELVLDEACHTLQRILRQKYHLPYLWSLIPGELQAWPLSGIKNIFRIATDLSRVTGIRLQADYSLSPVYSRCGFFYYTETEFEGCQVCSREPCMMRRAQYNPDLARQKGLKIGRVCGKDTA